MTSRRKQAVSSLALVLTMIFFGFDTKRKGNKRKNKQVGLYKTKKLLHSKENHQENEKATYRMGKNTYTSYT